VVHKYSATGQHLGQALASDAITAQQGTGIAAMKLAGDNSKLLLTTGGPVVQRIDIDSQKPVPGAPHGGCGAPVAGPMLWNQSRTGMCSTQCTNILRHSSHHRHSAVLHAVTM
jgi:hypothetical protein